MLGISAAAFAMLWTALSAPLQTAASTGPVSYADAVASEAYRLETDGAENSSAADEELELSTEQQALLESEPDWRASARLYHAGGGGATGRDSLGCQPIAMRTVAVDPRVIPRRTRLFIHETVGMRMSDGSVHDGYWYASDTGGAIKGEKVDLFTGHGRNSMRPIMNLNMKTLTIADAGRFDGCPPAWETASR